MQKGHVLQFHCQSCHHPIHFSVFELEQKKEMLSCENCDKKYCFNDKTLKRQLQKFEALCRQIHESEEILADTAVGIDIGERQIKVPYRLLLTRLNSILHLTMDEAPLAITFRIEPSKDIPKMLEESHHE